MPIKISSLLIQMLVNTLEKNEIEIDPSWKKDIDLTLEKLDELTGSKERIINMIDEPANLTN